MTVSRLMDRLVPNIVSENDWKKFWTQREKLKTDASIEIQKNDLILLNCMKGYHLNMTIVGLSNLT